MSNLQHQYKHELREIEPNRRLVRVAKATWRDFELHGEARDRDSMEDVGTNP